MLIRGIARNGRGTKPVVNIARFSGTDRTGSGESGEYCRRSSRGVGRVGFFLFWNEGLPLFDSFDYSSFNLSSSWPHPTFRLQLPPNLT